MPDIGTAASLNGAAKASGQLGGIKERPQLTIVRVENGYQINPPYYGGEPKVAKLLNEMLDIVQDYFEDKKEEAV